ncbi:MAG: MAPEG family protein [Wenzhouxiangella sp.]
MTYSITLLYTGLSGLLLLALSFQVVALRRRHGVGLGSGDQPALERAIRVHANFCEYVPLGLLLLLVLELSAALPSLILHALGVMLVLGRILHALGLSRSAGVSSGRFVGTLLTWLMLAVAALLAVGIAVGGIFGRMAA